MQRKYEGNAKERQRKYKGNMEEMQTKCKGNMKEMQRNYEGNIKGSVTQMQDLKVYEGKVKENEGEGRK